ncbi:MAG: acyl-CoA/acyl-ACP dehydrogenase [Candidatus Caldarchaeum sp.]|nr:acyl-CoA/acyl-ACP dehydrogenase [Candidatus Caldarchaeum sp.]MCS7138225.1 acyl-CoA/acyl-ACP dehydrogenase [Candidatus Caldarchaeum sp.]MDW7977658.1 acyl-CoA dehydrogenase family protein [Candidatus Caldarchaeum sp.]MDW8360207.1 acyl-CoA dehydrogenase family protein [Candidatus Caldarchaeum sp.]
MDFQLSPEQTLLRDKVSEFCKRVIEPRWLEIDEKGEIGREVVEKMAGAGLPGMTISMEYGGQEGSFLEAAIAGEELAYHGPALSLAVMYLIQCSWGYILQLYGSEDARREILPRIASGDAAIGIASTEAHGGSDVASVKCRAVKTDDRSWSISGEKTMVSLPTVIERMPWGGGWFLIARTGDPALKHRTITDFVLLMKKNGKKVENISYTPWTEFARKGLDTSVLTIDNVLVDDVYRVGPVNGGFKIAMEGFNLARTMIGAICVGCARWLMDRALEWVRTRQVFGKPLSAYQGVSFKLADFATELEAAKLLSYKAAWTADRYYRDKQGTLADVAKIGAMSKLKCASLAVDIGEEVMKIHGGAAYFKETPIFRAWLAAFSYVVGAEGAENILKLIVAREVIGKEYVE